MAQGSSKSLSIMIDSSSSEDEQSIKSSEVIEIVPDSPTLIGTTGRNDQSDPEVQYLEIHVPVKKKVKFNDDDDNDKKDCPIYEHPPDKYSAEEIIHTLLDPPMNKICHKKPESITQSATYIVDTSSLKDVEDIKKDNFGIWKYSGSHPQTFKILTEDDGRKVIERCSKSANGSNVVHLRRLHCTHPSNKDFKRLICFLSDHLNNRHQYCLLIYRLPQGFTPVISSHGNSKDNKPYFPTWPSTRTLMQSQCLQKGPKATVQHVSSEVGGLLQSVAPGQLPRNEKQVTIIRRVEKAKQTSTVYANDKADELFVIMQKAQTEDPSSQFIRAIRSTPDPAIVLFKDYQLNDLIRFCTTSKFSIMTIDPTFSLGDFDVTPITYRNMILERRRTKNHPIFLGPTLIHYRKTFGVYLFFASTLVGASPNLQGVTAFGTDGEEALAQAFGHEFAFAERLLCFNHVRRNIKEKCSEFCIPTEITNKIISDILGSKSGENYFEGLVDSVDDEDFHNKLESVITLWNNIQGSSSTNIEGFINWFKKYKCKAICDCMLRPIREKSGLGCPPGPFTTNASESLNAILKNKLDYKKSELPTLVEKLKELVLEQNVEAERAIVGRGKYKLKEQYTFLEVPETKWFQMSSEQRQKHISKLHGLSVMECSSTTLNIVEIAGSSDLSIDISCVAEQLNIPLPVLEGIWSKAKKLLNTEGAISTAPGQAKEARMVLSYSGKMPHLVVAKKNGDFACDSSCPNFKSMGLCAHSIVVADINNQLSNFLSSSKRKVKPNITNLLTTAMPKGRGRKGSNPPRSRKRNINQEPTNRIEFNTGEISEELHVPSSNTYQPPPTTSFQSISPSSIQVPLTYSEQFLSPSSNMTPVAPTYSHHGPSNLPHPPFLPASSLYLPGSSPTFGFSDPPPTPFVLHKIAGNISVCIGCRNKYGKNLAPPYDMCIQHKEWREFVKPGSESPQSRFGNVYYHFNPNCIWLRCPYFNPSMLDVPRDLQHQLSSVHKSHLANIFGIEL